MLTQDDDIAGFRLHTLLDQSDCAQTWLARSPQDAGLLRALALDRADTDTRKRFEQEAELLSQLHPPGVLPLLHEGEISVRGRRVRYIVARHLPGRSLDQIRAAGTLPAAGVRAIGIELCNVVHSFHTLANAAGLKLYVLHRDLRPTEVVLTDQGSIVLVGFYLGRIVTALSRVTWQGGPALDPRYLAPEAARQEAWFEAEQFAIGVVLVELWTGHAVFSARARPAGVVRRSGGRLTFPGVPPADRALADVLSRMTMEDPRQRYTDAAQAATALAASGPRWSREALAALGQPREGEPTYGIAPPRSVRAEAEKQAPLDLAWRVPETLRNWNPRTAHALAPGTITFDPSAAMWAMRSRVDLLFDLHEVRVACKGREIPFGSRPEKKQLFRVLCALARFWKEALPMEVINQEIARTFGKRERLEDAEAPKLRRQLVELLARVVGSAVAEAMIVLRHGHLYLDCDADIEGELAASRRG